jgi:hypothetical protein
MRKQTTQFLTIAGIFALLMSVLESPTLAKYLVNQNCQLNCLSSRNQSKLGTQIKTNVVVKHKSSLFDNSISRKVESRNLLIDGREDPDPNKAILPAKFKVYVKDNVVVNTSYPDFEEKILPTVNKFVGTPGCYIAAYSPRKEKSVYSVGGDIYVMGQVRVSGSYQDRICQPVGYENADISAARRFKLMFALALPSACKKGCWAGGDTGGWFGIE